MQNGEVPQENLEKINKSQIQQDQPKKKALV